MLRVREIHRDTEQTISVVETVETWQNRTATYCHAAGRIEPLAVIVRRPDSEYAIDVNAEPVDAAHLARMLDQHRVDDVTT